MKIWVYVEGQSDTAALDALWAKWKDRLREHGIGVRIISLENKSKLLRRIGERSAEKLAGEPSDLVVALPDLYPNTGFGTRWDHSDLPSLQAILRREVGNCLRNTHGIQSQLSSYLDRFCPSALKHDLEMTLLAAKTQLRAFLGTTDELVNKWVHPVENQNQQSPPKRVVEGLFMTYKKRAYRDTVDAPAVLRRVDDIRAILRNKRGQPQCPVFEQMIDWIGQKTGVTAFA